MFSDVVKFSYLRIKLLLQDLQLDWERGVNMNEEGEIENFRRATRKGLNPHSLDSLVHDGTMLSYYPVLDGNARVIYAISVA